uniref:Uncharacterized protein n=1 Tax=Anguilla anguilla TaxID=7936 RepID=A0A0E9PZ85_ANGAN
MITTHAKRMCDGF